MHRCPWAKTTLSIEYHDHEWGVPAREERVLFEFLILEGAQAGLSWETILAKRERYRQVFDGFDPVKIARYRPVKIAALLTDPGIIRNRLKVVGTVTNAKALLALHESGTTLSETLWSFLGGKPKLNRWGEAQQVPAKTPESDAMSKHLKARGFTFVGSTICYALMQATGMVNDHLLTCPRHEACAKLG